jgi:hypothetical protein
LAVSELENSVAFRKLNIFPLGESNGNKSRSSGNR